MATAVAQLSAADRVRGVQHEQEPSAELDRNYKNIVIVDNIPIVDGKRYDRLSAVIRKIFAAFGEIKEMSIPQETEGTMSTYGYGFVEYKTVAEAAMAVKEGDNKKLDNKHKLRVNLFDDFDKYMDISEEYETPEIDNFESQSDLTSWEKDSGRNWTEQYAAWSTHGQYLATFHAQGIALWGGRQFNKLGRFSHPNVSYIDFSPGEKYVVTSNGRDRSNKNEPYCIQFWDIRTAKLLRGFDKGASKGGWPAFKWSHDDNFIARCQEDTISVYEIPSMNLLDKQSFKIPDVQECVWSPTQNILAYWCPEKDNIPARVALLEIPSRTILREKHLYNVQDVKLHWQASGDYLCVKLARKKTKKTIIHNFEIFRLRQKNVPVEVLEIEDNIVAFAWEPVGSRFAIIHGNAARPDVSIYNLKEKKLVLLKTFAGRPCNCLFWSPTGDYLVVAGMGDKNGALEFINMNDMDHTVQTEHHMCTDVEWDPSGRFIMTSVTQPMNVAARDFRATMENGYMLWSCSGVQLAKVPVDPCYQVLWRPRPRSLLTKDQVADVKKTLKDKYWKRFDEEDNEVKNAQLDGAARERFEWKAAWKAFRAASDQSYADEAQERRELRNGQLSEDDEDFVEMETVHEEEISYEATER